MYKSFINYKKGQCLEEKSTGCIYQISIGGIHGVYIKKKFKDFYLSATDIEKYYRLWSVENGGKYQEFLKSFKTYFLECIKAL